MLVSRVRIVRDDLALAQNDDAVTDREHVGQSMADQDDGNAVLLEGADKVEHVLDLPHGERCGRLVHDDKLGIEGERAGDGDRLLLAAGELAGHLSDRGNARAEP